jgi:hypothetical protein
VSGRRRRRATLHHHVDFVLLAEELEGFIYVYDVG